MNIPSHHQSAFFAALEGGCDVDLKVFYFSGPSASRAQEGWASEYVLEEYESCIDSASFPSDILKSLPDWMERVHIISGNFSADLVQYFCEHKVHWCHWSEMPGIRLAELLGYRMNLYRVLNPMMLALKFREGALIRKHALGAFGQGVLARKAFRCMGIPKNKTSDLYYTPMALPNMSPCQQVQHFAKGRKVFLSVAALCARKGIDILLKSFARMKTDEWCLVFCGLDKTDGTYHELAEKLNISDQVLFLGAYRSDRIAEVYSSSDVFVLPSRFDGWGAVLNEAASLGLPLIGTDLCGASWHVIEDGHNGFRVRAGSVSSLANAMQAYQGDHGLILRHGSVSYERFVSEFSPEKNVKRLVESLAHWRQV